jgi:site-specific DNA recombinase
LQRDNKDAIAAIIRKVALYARVSKDMCAVCEKAERGHAKLDHQFKGQDPEVQLQPLRKMCADRGWLITKEYVDKGWGGAKDSRPELDRLMVDVKHGHQDFDAVVVWKFDRFSRHAAFHLQAFETMQECKTAYISLTEPIDTGTHYGKFILTVLAGIAELERGVTVERIGAGMRKQGAKRPGPKIGEQGPSRTTLWRRSQQSGPLPAN